MKDEIVYRINADDEIVHVNEAWDLFAKENAAEHLISSQILKRRIWDFVQDIKTEHLYHDILQKARHGRTFCYPLRCDAPDRRRLLQMTVIGCENLEVEFRSRLLSTETRTPIAASNPTLAMQLLVVCGWCKRIDIGGSWVEIEAALVRLSIFESTMLPAVTHSICDGCEQAMRAMLGPG